MHQILGFPVPIFLTCLYTAFSNFFHFLAHKISKISTRMDALSYPELTASAGQEKEDLGRSNTPPFTASPNAENLLSISPTVLYIRDSCFLPQVYLIFIHYPDVVYQSSSSLLPRCSFSSLLRLFPEQRRPNVFNDGYSFRGWNPLGEIIRRAGTEPSRGDPDHNESENSLYVKYLVALCPPTSSFLFSLV
jgi:hypothetical protein